MTWEVMGAKHDKVKKTQGKGQTKGKTFQQESLILTALTTRGTLFPT
jgi:hypothetical protein